MSDAVPSPPANELLSLILRSIVDHPDSVIVTVTTQDDATDTTLNIRVHPEDIGKVIGKNGHTIRAVRTLMGGAGMKQHRRYVIILDDKDHGDPAADSVQHPAPD
jgi:predicted RNA-binding protein YlqC (UPF0109 family)